MFQFFQMLLDYKIPRIGNECNKNMNWGQLGTFDTKMRRKYPWLLFLYSSRAPTFSRHLICPLKICFTNKVNTICGVGQLLAADSQGRKSQGPGSQFQSPRFPGPRASGLRVPGFRVSGLRVLSLVSGPDLRLCCSFIWCF